ncbi:MAG: SGNH/GDSL hydrolase family protein [Actinomycetota bacterium]|nr:SGNH/GDSL hydrolase family protein [Actinomycetota bacterium]
MVAEIPRLTEIPDAEAQDPYVLSPVEQSELLAGHPWSSFAVLGDSIAMGMGDPTEGYARATWGGRVAAALAREREGATYANLAQHGAKAADIRDSQLGPALDLEPDLVALIGGGNDCLFAEEFDIAPVKAAIDDTVVALADAGATVVTYETVDFPRAFPDPDFEEFNRRLMDLYAATREIAWERGTPHVDCYIQPWSSEPYLFSEDLQRPTTRAQALAASMTIRVFGEHLRSDGR